MSTRSYLLFVMDRWMSSAGGIQTLNRELACTIAQRRTDIQCIVLVKAATDDEKKNALARGVELIAGDSEEDWTSSVLSPEISSIPQQDVIAVIGHSYFSGKQASCLRTRFFPSALFVHFAHMNSFDTESLKEYRSNSYVIERERKLRQEIEIAKKANLLLCTGPRLRRFMKDELSKRGFKKGVERIDCGLSRPTDDKERGSPPERPSILCLGRTDSIGVKGLDIFAFAAGYLIEMWNKNPTTKKLPAPHFIVRGAKEKPEELECKLTEIAHDICSDAIIQVRPYTADLTELRSDYCGASVFMMPSREEGFGLVAFEALSLGVPILVSSASGVAEVVQEIEQDVPIDLGNWIIDHGGTPSEIGRCYAEAAFKILAQEELSAKYTHFLRERLLNTCSWESGAERTLNFICQEMKTTEKTPQLVPQPVAPNPGLHHENQMADATNVLKEQSQELSAAEAEKNRSHIVQPVHPTETPHNKNRTLEATEVLKERSKELIEKPGVLAVSVKQAIMVVIEKGTSPDIPKQIDGVNVVIREVESLNFSAASGVQSGDLVLVNNISVACVGPLVVDEGLNVFACTAAHAIPTNFATANLSIRTANSVVPTSAELVDRKSDLALLPIPLPSNELVYAQVVEPSLGMQVRIILPGQLASGTVTGLDVAARFSFGDSTQLVRDMFEIQTSHEISIGASGALVQDSTEDLILGIVLGRITASDEGKISVFAQSISAFLSQQNLKALSSIGKENFKSKLTIGVLADSRGTLELLLQQIGNPVRTRCGDGAYFKGTIGQNSPVVYAAALPEIGNLASAIFTTKMLRDITLDYLFVIGLAGGLSPEQHVGDVVVSSEIVYYEPAKLTRDDIQPRFRILAITPRWLSSIAASIEISMGEIGIPAKNSFAIPQVRVGAIASGEKILTSSAHLESILGGWGKVIAIEMEGAGVAEAVSWSDRNIPVVVVRGIADILDSKDIDIDIVSRECVVATAIQAAIKLIRALPEVAPTHER